MNESQMVDFVEALKRLARVAEHHKENVYERTMDAAQIQHDGAREAGELIATAIDGHAEAVRELAEAIRSLPEIADKMLGDAGV